MVTTMRIDVRLTQKVILVKIYRLNQTIGLYPLTELADRAECGQNTALRHIRFLEKAGLLTVVVGSGRTPNKYIITDEGMSKIQNEL